ncbi:hypothetical protein V6N11_070540 [Hibiscus sabdariffa]|uniref:Uncharacterized protein n=1 Tax=Hibiscus sabdariffa TaxID=183260 RepID=A0ABR2QFC0_9ROSI
MEGLFHHGVGAGVADSGFFLSLYCLLFYGVSPRGFCISPAPFLKAFCLRFPPSLSYDLDVSVTVQEMKLAGVRFKNLQKILNRRRYIQSKEGIQNTSNDSLGLSIPPAVLQYFLELLETYPEQERTRSKELSLCHCLRRTLLIVICTVDGKLVCHEATIPEAAQLEKKVNEVEQIYLNANKKKKSFPKGTSIGKGQDKGKHVLSIKKQQEEASRREAAAAKRIPELMRQFGTNIATNLTWPFMQPVDVEGPGLHEVDTHLERLGDYVVRKRRQEKDKVAQEISRIHVGTGDEAGWGTFQESSEDFEPSEVYSVQGRHSERLERLSRIEYPSGSSSVFSRAS